MPRLSIRRVVGPANPAGIFAQVDPSQEVMIAGSPFAAISFLFQTFSTLRSCFGPGPSDCQELPFHRAIFAAADPAAMLKLPVAISSPSYSQSAETPVLAP